VVEAQKALSSLREQTAKDPAEAALRFLPSQPSSSDRVEEELELQRSQAMLKDRT